MLAIQRLRRAKVHRDSMLDDFVLLKNLHEDVERTSAIDHEIFGNDLEPVADRLLFENVVVVRNAQADPDAVLRKPVKAIGWHSDRLREEANLESREG